MKPVLGIAAPSFLALVALLGLAPSGHGQQSTVPPLELQALPQTWKPVSLLETSKDEYVRLWVAVNTRDKTIWFRWFARAAADVQPTILLTKEEVSFFPTAYDHSKVDPRVWNFAGRSFAPVLEEWTLGEFVLGREVRATGGAVTAFQPPRIVRASLKIDPGLGQIADIATNKWDPTGKHLLVLDWDAATVWAIDRATGARSVSIDPDEHPITPYRSISLNEHSEFGAVCRLFRHPFFVNPGRRSGVPDPDFFALCDGDKDGDWDNAFVIPWDSWVRHDLCVLGSFMD